MSHLVDQARADMQRAKRKVEDLRRQHNAAVVEFNKLRERHNRLAARQFDIELELARERQAAMDAGNAELAALLAGKVPVLR